MAGGVAPPGGRRQGSDCGGWGVIPNEDEPSTRARWLGVALILVALASLVWQAWDAEHAEPPPDGVPFAGIGNPSLSEMLGSVDGTRLAQQQAALAASSATAWSAAPASAPLAKDEAEACGVGPVKVNA